MGRGKLAGFAAASMARDRVKMLIWASVSCCHISECCTTFLGVREGEKRGHKMKRIMNMKGKVLERELRAVKCRVEGRVEVEHL